MKIKNPIIIPNVGFSSIKFGMCEEDISNILGPPEKIENPNEEGDIIYRYESKGINTLCFDREEKFRLVEIELNNKSNAILWNTRVFDKSFEEIAKISSSNGYSLQLKDIYEDEERNYFQEVYIIEPLNLDFYVDRLKSLNEISISVSFNKNDDVVLWPE